MVIERAAKTENEIEKLNYTLRTERDRNENTKAYRVRGTKEMIGNTAKLKS